MNDLIKDRQQKEKTLMVENLKKTPIVQLACEKSGIGRTTYYRWLKEDQDFSERAYEALNSGIDVMNDYAESQLLSAIKDKNLTAIIFWLKSRHKAFSPRLEVTAKQKDEDVITPEVQEEIKRAIKIASPDIYKEISGDTDLEETPNDSDHK